MDLKAQIDFEELKNIRFPIIIVTGIFVFFFLWFFQPFGLEDFKVDNKILFLSIYAINTSLVLFFAYILIPFLWKKFFTYQFWNVTVHLVYLVATLIFMGILNRIYSGLSGFYQFNPFSLVHHIFYTIAIGLTPIVIIVGVVDKVLLQRKFEDLAKKSRESLQVSQINGKENKSSEMLESKEDTEIKKVEKTVVLNSNNRSDEFSILASNIVYFKSDDNYVNIYFLNKGTISKRLMRITLSQIEKQLIGFDQIIRCHRSYIVNLDRVNYIKGNSQKYVFFLNDLSIKIPISKTFPQNIVEQFLQID